MRSREAYPSGVKGTNEEKRGEAALAKFFNEVPFFYFLGACICKFGLRIPGEMGRIPALEASQQTPHQGAVAGTPLIRLSTWPTAKLGLF